MNEFAIPLPGDSMNVSLGGCSIAQKEAILCLWIMAYGVEHSLTDTLIAQGAFPQTRLTADALPGVLARELGVGQDAINRLFAQGSDRLFSPLQSLPPAGRNLVLGIALLLLTPDSAAEISPGSSVLVAQWGLQMGVSPMELMPYLMAHGAALLRFLEGKQLPQN